MSEQYRPDSSGSIFLASDEDGSVLVRVLDRRQIPTAEAGALATERVARLSMLDEMGIAPIQGYSWEGDSPWIAVAAGPEVSLANFIAGQGVLGSRHTATLALFVAQIVDAMHSVDVIHANLRPSSVRVQPGKLLLADAGLYAPVHDLLGTGAGSTVVDAAWMTPEQLLGGSVSSMSDVYLWALVVLFAASGANPFAAGNARTALTRIRSEIPMVGNVLQEPLASMVTSALAKDPEARPPMSDIVRMLGGDRLIGPLGPQTTVLQDEPESIENSSDRRTGLESGEEGYAEGDTLAEEVQDGISSGSIEDSSLSDTDAMEGSDLVESTRRFPSWLVLGVIAAVVVGLAAGFLIGRFFVGSSLPQAGTQAATTQTAGVALGFSEEEGA